MSERQLACGVSRGSHACILPLGHEGPHDAHGFHWDGYDVSYALCTAVNPQTGFGCGREPGHEGRHSYHTQIGIYVWE